ncbi:hypothetical protein [Chitinimonas lacunae]|uniref:Uncharacterized protein n=1 Tax=Chitinimonas lacunae TaxID=1963018 RepID=A0ABV8MNQ6_9NEIS
MLASKRPVTLFFVRTVELPKTFPDSFIRQYLFTGPKMKCRHEEGGGLGNLAGVEGGFSHARVIHRFTDFPPVAYPAELIFWQA